MENPEIKRWKDAWDKAGSALAKIKAAELRDEDYYFKNLPLLNEMLNYAVEHRTVKKTSGLVIQQQLFKNIHDMGK